MLDEAEMALKKMKPDKFLRINGNIPNTDGRMCYRMQTTVGSPVTFSSGRVDAKALKSLPANDAEVSHSAV